jgi:anti-anti-sigma regulatory factor
MEIKMLGTNELLVTGIIKTIDDSMALRGELQKLYEGGVDSIVLKIEDSFAMPSAVIGYLMKLVNRDKVKLKLVAGDVRLYQLLDELSLTESFGVRYSGN